MDNEIPNLEIIENIYKDNLQNQSMTNLKANMENENNKNEDDISNQVISPYNLSPKGEKKRRQGVWLNNVFNKDEEKEEKQITTPKLSNEININDKKQCLILIKIIEKISNYINSQVGIIVMLNIISISIFFNDFRYIFLSRLYKKYYLLFYLLITFYYLFDCIFRMLIIENLIFTLDFLIDFITLILLMLDLDFVAFPILTRIIFNTSNKICIEEQNFIEMIVNCLHILRLLRVIKFYKLLNKIIEGQERRKFINKMVEKIYERKIKVNKGKNLSRLRSNATNLNNKNTSINFLQTPDNFCKSPQKRSKKNSIYLINPIINDNKKYKEEIKKNLEQHLPKQEKMSQEVTEGITKIMILIIILVIISSIYIDDDNYKEDFSYLLICKYINEFVKKKKINNYEFIINFINNYLLSNVLIQYPIIKVEWKNITVYQNSSMDLNFKNYFKRDIAFVFDKEEPHTIISIYKKNISKITSILFLLRLVYIVFCVSILCILINKDLYDLIFHPLEKIGKVIDVVSKDPVGSKTITELKSDFEYSSNQKFNNSLGNEIKIIQSAIIRISALMAINFGEAGGEILKENISSSEGLNPMLSGKKINAIFGFCFIHNFSEINEAFQEKTMIFVNQISDIVHSCVDKFNGITNKNLGDCYLLAWKFKEKTEYKNSTNYVNNTNKNNTNINGSNDNQISNPQSLVNSNLSELKNIQLADCALLSFLNIIKKINKSQNILSYRKDVDLLKKFGPKYTVQMGFGLHTGWGIEGAIGSYYKIDCSYLSPNVNIAARLETATNIYGVDILFSGEFYDLLSDFMKRKCRKIDIVTLKGSEKPVRLYTVDINKNIHPGKIVSKKDRMTLRERRSYYGLKKKKLWHKYYKLHYKYSIGELYIKQSKGLRQLLRHNKSDMFYQYFEDGFNDYIDGEWKEAYQFLLKARYLDKSDGPTKTILDYIKSLNLTPPSNWDGYRVLTSKT